VFERRMLKKINMWQEITEGWRKLHDKKLNMCTEYLNKRQLDGWNM
jgi:hypothetical protein